MWSYIITGIYIYMCICVPCEPTIQRNLFHRQAEPSLLQVCFINLLWPFELVSQMLSQQRPHVQWLIHEHEADIAWIIVDPWNASNASLQPPTYCARRHVIKRQHAHSLTAEVMTNIQREKDGRLSRGQLNQPFSHTRIRVCIHANVHRHIISYCESTICLQPPRLQSADWMWRQPRPLGNKCSMYSP